MTGQIPDRPVTQQGMMGMQSASRGPGRQVLDKTYYLNELRNKNKELFTQMELHQKEIVEKDKGNQMFVNVEKKYMQLQKEVKELQGTLADYNIILDKVGTDASLDDLRLGVQRLQTSNENERNIHGQVLSERIQSEHANKDMETQINNVMGEMEQMLKELAPAKREEYKSLQSENNHLQNELARMEGDLEEASRQLSQYEGELQKDQIKQRALSLQQQIADLSDKRRELQAEESKLSLSPEEQRARLKDQIKRDNADIARAEQQIQELQQAIRRGESKLQEARGDLSDQSGALDEAEKYEKLLRDERELTTFIEEFDGNRANVQNDIAAKQQNITAMLEKVSRHIQLQGNMPNQKRFKEMQDELEYKKQQVQNAATTQSRLVQEKELRQQELEKISTLEEKIKVELAGLEEKSKIMNEEIVKFAALDTLKHEAEEIKRQLEVDRVSFGKRREALNRVVMERSAKYEAKKEQLQGNDVYATLEKLEQKMRTMEQGVVSMTDYISAKEAETDYSPMLKGITEMYDELNVELQRKAML